MNLFLRRACLRPQCGQGDPRRVRAAPVRSLAILYYQHDRHILWAGSHAGRSASGRHSAGQHGRILPRLPRSSSTKGTVR